MKTETTPNRYRQALARLTRPLLVVLCFSAVLNLLMLTGSIYMLQVYDRVLVSGSLPTLMGLFGIVVLLYGFLGFYDFLRNRLMSRLALRLDRAVGEAAFRRWVGGGQVPDGTAPPLRDLDTVRGWLGGGGANALFDLPFVPLFLAVLFLVHPLLGWATVAGAAVGAGLAALNAALTRGATGRAAGLDAAEREFTERSRRAGEAVAAMRMQEAVGRRWSDLHDQALASAQAGGDPAEVLAAISRAFRMLLQSAILTLGAWLVLKQEISGGMIIASSILSGRALAPLDQLTGQWKGLGRTLAAHHRLVAVFGAQPPAAKPIDLPDPTGTLELTGVGRLGPARPGTDRVRILSGISFALASGDGLGVIGNSASGKSTLARLIAGVILPDEGEIRLDGATQDQWHPTQLGRMIGYLPQSVEMLPGSIRDNIARFDPEIDDEAVIAAARLAGVHEMILKLPDGYATRLGSAEAPPLSGGQVQRLGLARAICGMPAIVVLDEPNSNLDVAGDNALIATVHSLREAGSTVIVMAHRPSAIAAVNKLLVLEGGRIRAFGEKEQVLAEVSSGQAPGHTAAAAPPRRGAAFQDEPMPAVTVSPAVARIEAETAQAARARARRATTPSVVSAGSRRA